MPEQAQNSPKGVLILMTNSGISKIPLLLTNQNGVCSATIDGHNSLEILKSFLKTNFGLFEKMTEACYQKQLRKFAEFDQEFLLNGFVDFQESSNNNINEKVNTIDYSQNHVDNSDSCNKLSLDKETILDEIIKLEKELSLKDSMHSQIRQDLNKRKYQKAFPEQKNKSIQVSSEIFRVEPVKVLEIIDKNCQIKDYQKINSEIPVKMLQVIDQNKQMKIKQKKSTWIRNLMEILNKSKISQPNIKNYHQMNKSLPAENIQNPKNTKTIKENKSDSKHQYRKDRQNHKKDETDCLTHNNIKKNRIKSMSPVIPAAVLAKHASVGNIYNGYLLGKLRSNSKTAKPGLSGTAIRKQNSECSVEIKKENQ